MIQEEVVGLLDTMAERESVDEADEEGGGEGTQSDGTVAYFTDGKPTKGSSDFEQLWQDARWQFASATNRDLFTANPDRYAPQYGGYCAGGLAVGEYADIDPEAWTIVEGKLYLNKTMELRQVWRKGPEAHIEFANYNWENNRGNLRDNY